MDATQFKQDLCRIVAAHRGDEKAAQDAVWLELGDVALCGIDWHGDQFHGLFMSRDFGSGSFSDSDAQVGPLPCLRAIWRPADVATNGVAAIGTRGHADTWPAPTCTAPGQGDTGTNPGRATE